MRRFALILALTLAAISSWAAKTQLTIDKIDPPYWWTGMNNDTLQLLVYGKNVGLADLTIKNPDVKIVEIVPETSDNHKIVYLTINPVATPGNIDLQFTLGKKKVDVPYQLKARTWKGTDNPGFDASDVLYLIMPDRFADADTTNNNIPLRHRYTTNRHNKSARHGGDIAGMRRHLDYIDNLGVTAVWVNPVLENDMPMGSYHGYATTDYYAIDPRFGSNQEWTDFVEDAHSRGIKVVMDMIFNHSGSAHPWMDQAPMADWYNHPDGSVMTNHRLSTIYDPYVSDYDLDVAVNGWFVPSMPDLNQRNTHMMNYLIQNSIFWIEDSKIDGIRMDTYPYADMMEMSRWIAQVEREYPNFNIVGECWYPSEGSEAFWQRNSKVNPQNPNLLTVMDFNLALDGNKAFTEQTNGPAEGLNRLYSHLALDYLFPDPQHILTFLDNHDTDRFLPSEPSDLGSWKQAIAYLLTSRGIPQIYYGTEILMNGTRADGGDGNVRRDMPGGFPGDTISIFTPQGRTPIQNQAYDYISKILNWRKGTINPVIAKGTLKHFVPRDGVYIYERRLGDKAVDIIMNGTDQEVTIPMDHIAEILPVGTITRDIITDHDIIITDEMTFHPRQTLILER